MRRVLHLRASAQLLGAERVVLELTEFLPRFGYECVIGIPVEAGEPVSSFAAEAERLGHVVEGIPISGAFDLSALGRVRRLVEEREIDVVHSHGYREDLYALGCRRRAKLVATNHLWKRTTSRLKLYAGLDALLLRGFDRIIAVSRPVFEDMRRAGLPADRIDVIANGVDPGRFSAAPGREEARRALGLPAEGCVLGTLSSLSVEKGLVFAIEALARLLETHPATRLLIVGDGEARGELEAAAREAGVLESVTFAGRRADVATVLAALDVFWLPSLSEGLPMALLEAMAAQRAVVATPVGDVATVVDEGCGRLVAPGDAAALAEATEPLIADPTLRESLAQAARRRILESFSSERMAERHAEVYDRLFEAKAKATRSGGAR